MRYNRYKKSYQSIAGKLRKEGRQYNKKPFSSPSIPKPLKSLKKKSYFISSFNPPILKGELIGTIYGLFSTDNVGRIEYVGATASNPLQRLYGHKCGANSKKVFAWITDLKNRGQDVGMEILGNYPYPELSAAEAAWTLFYQEQNQATLNDGIRSSHLRKLYVSC